jgi:5'(3')-deoxyribonucleotidase
MSEGRLDGFESHNDPYFYLREVHMKIGIDFDGVINNLLDTWVEWLNRYYHEPKITVEDIKQWHFRKYFPELTEEDFLAPLFVPEFWDEVTIKPDAPEVIERLLAEGHKVYIVTSSHYMSLPHKLPKCLFAKFPFLTEKNVITVYDKSLINVDLLLDDAEHNLKDFTGIRVLFDASYNKFCTVMDYRISSWKEFYILVSELSQSLRRPPYSRIHQYKADRGMGKTAWLHQMIYDSVHGDSADTKVPCYLIAPTQAEFERFCRSYRERFSEVCPAKLFELNQRLENNARLFVDMPSLLPIKSEAFTAFKCEFNSREHLMFIADFENTHWHAVIYK